MDNYDPNQAAADALKNGMNATNSVSALMSIISGQVERLKVYKAQLQGAELSMLINNTVFNKIQDEVKDLRNDDVDLSYAIDAIEKYLKGPDLKPGTPEDMQKQVQDWIKSLGEETKSE